MPKLPALILCCVMAAACNAIDAAAAAPLAVSDQDFPGTIQLSVDATDVSRRILQVRERIPVQPGPLTLWYPQWIPGNHAATGPINQLAGLQISGNGQAISWRRDPLDMYAFQVDVPAGVAVLDLQFQYLSPTAGDQGRVAMTTDLMSVQWHRVLLYPAGFDARRILVQPELRLPAGWGYASALGNAERAQETNRFQPLPLVDLIDSPVYAGRYFKRFDLDPGAKAPVYLNVIADAPEQLQATPQMLAAHRALVQQADRVFGARPFAHYDFLLAVSDSFSGIGLEHHQSSENGTFADYLRGDAPFYDNDLLAHEYTHAWNGKFMRPAPTWVPHFNMPVQNDLLWVYEGQTQFWAVVLAARAQFWNRQQTLEVLANTAASLDQRSGRRWRNLGDTVYQGIIDFNDAPQAAESWQRGYDFYTEGSLLWLDVDAKLRELSSGKRSLDDFARRFYGNSQGKAQVKTYDMQDVVASLNAVQAHDWAGFLQTRVQGHEPNLPLQGLQRAGWELVFDDQPNLALADMESEQEFDDFSYSLGLKIASEQGKINEVVWDSPAHAQGLAKDMQVIAVDGMAYDAQRLRRALVAAKSSQSPIQLLVRQGDAFRTVQLDYHDGLRYPHLQRIARKPDLLSQLLTPLK